MRVLFLGSLKRHGNQFFFWCFWVGLFVFKPKVYIGFFFFTPYCSMKRQRVGQDDQESFLPAVIVVAASVQPAHL